MWHNKNTNEIQSNNPWGNSWICEELKQQYYDQGWSQVADDFVPAMVLTTRQKISALNGEYLPKFSVLKDAIQAADALDESDTVASLKAAYFALHEEYNAAMEAIEGE